MPYIRYYISEGTTEKIFELQFSVDTVELIDTELEPASENELSLVIHKSIDEIVAFLGMESGWNSNMGSRYIQYKGLNVVEQTDS